MSSRPMRAAALLAATALVSACGGGAKTVLNAGPNGLPYGQAGLTADAATMSTTYADVTFSGKLSRSLFTEDTTGPTVTNAATGANGTAQITVRDGNTIDLTFGGTTVRFTRQSNQTLPFGQGTGDLWTDSGGTISAIFGLSGSSVSPTVLNSVFFGFVDQTQTPSAAPNVLYSDSFFVSGFETNPNQINAGTGSALATATYTGPAWLFMRRANSSQVDAQQAVLESSTGMNLTANFGSTALTGTLSGPTDAALGTGTMILDVTGTISGNGFTGTFVENGASTSTLSITPGSTELSGTFFGANAAEIGGVFSAGIDNNGGTVPENTVASGVFFGN